MINPAILRTAAVLFADDTALISPRTIHMKIVESIFLDKGNAELSVNALIDAIKLTLQLTFDEKEIRDILNAPKESNFIVRHDTKTHEAFIRLDERRFATLNSKATNHNISTFIGSFITNHYRGSLEKDAIESTLQLFVYELLNKNIKAFGKLLSSRSKADDIAIDANLFTLDERRAVNDFIDWDNPAKNKSLFHLISYAIEYSLISNNVTGNPHLGGLKKKFFYLDNNVIYRALGINGQDRQKRICEFLKKCTDNGQTLFISKYTREEFFDTINHHISSLQKVPFGRINPWLFTKYAVNPSMYEFYHRWRDGRTAYAFTTFLAHISSLYDQFLKTFHVVEDFRVPFDEQGATTKKTIDEYTNDIMSFKGTGFEKTHRYDALNTHFVEQKRGANNIKISDTKYYFVSVDQRLRNWDFNRNDLQPIAMLPSQWMAILLRYYSRTDDDYRSYVGFLKLRQEKNLLEEEQLQYIVAGISEMTEDFDKQNTIFEKMAENSFQGILDRKDPKATASSASLFARQTLDIKMKDMQDAHQKDIEDAAQLYQRQKQEFEKHYKNQLLEEIRASITQLKNLRDISEAPIQSQFRRHLFLFSLPFVGNILIWSVLIYFLGWDKMEPLTYIVTLGFLLVEYLYMAIKGEHFNPLMYLSHKKEEIRRSIHREYRYDETVLSRQMARGDELERELNPNENRT